MPETAPHSESPSEALPEIPAEALETVGRSALRTVPWGSLALAALAVLLSLTSGLVGALLALQLRPSPPPPLRIAIVDTTRIAEAVGEASQRDAGLVQRFPARFDELIRQLQEAEPNRLFLVREAVVGSAAEDITPLILQDLREPPHAPALPSFPPGPKSSPGSRSHGP